MTVVTGPVTDPAGPHGPAGPADARCRTGLCGLALAGRLGINRADRRHRRWHCVMAGLPRQLPSAVVGTASRPARCRRQREELGEVAIALLHAGRRRSARRHQLVVAGSLRPCGTRRSGCAAGSRNCRAWDNAKAHTTDRAPAHCAPAARSRVGALDQRPLPGRHVVSGRTAGRGPRSAPKRIGSPLSSRMRSLIALGWLGHRQERVVVVDRAVLVDLHAGPRCPHGRRPRAARWSRCLAVGVHVVLATSGPAPRPPSASDVFGLNGVSSEPNGVDLVTLPCSEVRASTGPWSGP